ncbi:MAG: MarR family transcriptional regulator [Thermoplasmata archaeon]|nr:MarR family transcriptional regulator [Thermoplasmata archaeon]
MKQLTFDEIKEVHLTEQDRRVLLLLRESNTQSQTARKLRVPKSTVCTVVKKLEKAKLIRKKWAGNRYNILYDVLDRSVTEPAEAQKITTIRVHNVSRKRKILTPHYQLSVDKRAGWEKDWLMRGRVKWYKYSFLGGVGEPSVSLTITPKTIIGYLDAKQYVISESVEEAEDKAKQHVDKAIEKFIQVQAGFGNCIRIEGVSVPISKIHYGGQGATNHPAVQEVLKGKVKDWFGDQSLDELGLSGITEVETVVRRNALQFEKAMRFPEVFPDLLNPLAQSIQRVEALMQGETTAERKIGQLIGVIGSLLERLNKIEERMEGMQ